MELVLNGKEECNNHICIDEKVLSDSLGERRLKDKLVRLPALSSECSIYRAPAEIRDGNDKAFTPQMISIGPLHHNDDKLKDMEEHKLRFLKDFLLRHNVSLHDCMELVKKNEEKLRNCYAEAIEFDRVKFIEIILVDAAFIVEVFLRNYPVQKEKQNQNDRFFNRPWKLRFIKRDMLLLENQIPFFIIEDLLSLAGSAIPVQNDVRHSAIKLTYEFFKKRLYLVDLKFKVEEKVGQSQIHHFLDFVRICHLPSEMPCKSKLESLTIPTATQLHQAGIKFKVKKSGDLFDIQFNDGILQIPCLKIYDATESFLRNLMAYEHYHLKENYVSDYVFIIDRLIDAPGDVELLTHNGIIQSKLSGSAEVASMINKLSPGIPLLRGNFYFSNLCEQLNDYYKAPWNKWRATLKQDYFSSPWAIISFVAAIVLLLLTLLQTIYSVVSYY